MPWKAEAQLRSSADGIAFHKHPHGKESIGDVVRPSGRYFESLLQYDLLTCLQVLRFLRFERKILHRDISVGNVMYIEEPEIPTQNGVERLFFSKYLLGDRYVSRC